MINRKTRARRQKIIRWGSIASLVLLILLFIASLVTKQSPVGVISELWRGASGNTDDPETMNKRVLRQYVLEQNETIDSLRQALEVCGARRVRKGIVNVDSPTLNMRSLPSLKSDILIRIPNGTEVSVNYFDVEKYFLDGVQGQWYNITHANQVGWVWGPYIELED